MDLADRLTLLARRIPGVAGYQDLESSRDTDKLVRLRLADSLDEIARSLEGAKRAAVGRRQLDALPALESMGGFLNRVANEIRYASRGYRGFLDRQKIDQQKLERLYQFDLELLDEVEAIREAARKVDQAETATLAGACSDLSRTIEVLSASFNARQRILDEE